MTNKELYRYRLYNNVRKSDRKLRTSGSFY